MRKNNNKKKKKKKLPRNNTHLHSAGEAWTRGPGGGAVGEVGRRGGGGGGGGRIKWQYRFCVGFLLLFWRDSLLCV